MIQSDENWYNYVMHLIRPISIVTSKISFKSNVFIPSGLELEFFAERLFDVFTESIRHPLGLLRQHSAHSAAPHLPGS